MRRWCDGSFAADCETFSTCQFGPKQRSIVKHVGLGLKWIEKTRKVVALLYLCFYRHLHSQPFTQIFSDPRILKVLHGADRAELEEFQHVSAHEMSGSGMQLVACSACEVTCYGFKGIFRFTWWICRQLSSCFPLPQSVTSGKSPVEPTSPSFRFDTGLATRALRLQGMVFLTQAETQIRNYMKL